MSVQKRTSRNTKEEHPRNPSPKKRYRVTNWSQYDRALVARGDLTLWFDDQALETVWNAPAMRKNGRPFTYSDVAVEAVLTLKAVFHLTNRSVEGFTRSLMRKLGHDLPVPDHTLLSRRARTLTVAIARTLPPSGLHMVIDSTGLKVYGEGEWKVKQHGAGKRRTWRKVHLGVDAETGQVVAIEVTGAGGADCDSVPGLLDQVDAPIEQVSADGSYDKRKVYQALAQRGIRAAIPPREDAALWEKGHVRNAAVEKIRRDGFKAWAKEVGYHQRSLVESTMFRLKRLLGDRLASRDPERQAAEIHVRIACLNRMAATGMPVSVAIPANA